jgi:hypothetical protein
MDMAELKKVTVYDGYKPNDDTIIYFWEVRVFIIFSTSPTTTLSSTSGR